MTTTKQKIYRDYKLTLTNPKSGASLDITNRVSNGQGLRISFNIQLISLQNRSMAAQGSFCQFQVTIFNLGVKVQKTINDGKYTTLYLEAGYRDANEGGTISSNPVIVNGDIYNAFSYGDTVDVYTTLIGMTNSSVFTTVIDKSDLLRNARNTSQSYSPKEVFLYYIKKYMKNALPIIREKNLTGFASLSTATEKPFGVTFKPGTTLSQALSLIVGTTRTWYITNQNILIVIPTINSSVPVPFDESNAITVSSSNGLIGVPVLSAASSLSVKSLLNAALAPGSSVIVKVTDGFKQSSINNISSAFTADTKISSPTAKAVIMSVTIEGDSRVGEWTTTFDTLPASFIKTG